MPAVQRELIPDAGTWERCQNCDNPLSRQKHANQRTRLFGLCYFCLPDFEQSSFFCVDTYLKNANRCQQKNRRTRIVESRRMRQMAWNAQEHAEIRARLSGIGKRSG